MKTNLQFDFTVNKENNTILIKRAFKAPRKLVWKAWTVASILDQWWGPKPWRAITKNMDFREGGHWLYVMAGPAGEEFWSKVNYLGIQIERSISARDGFCNDRGEMNPDFPQNDWISLFIDEGENTLVDMTLTFDKLEDLEQTIAMGFKEGFAMGLDQLDELLNTLDA